MFVGVYGMQMVAEEKYLVINNPLNCDSIFTPVLRHYSFYLGTPVSGRTTAGSCGLPSAGS